MPEPKTPDMNDEDKLNVLLTVVICRFRGIEMGVLSTRMYEDDLSRTGAWIDKSRSDPLTKKFADWLLRLASEDAQSAKEKMAKQIEEVIGAEPKTPEKLTINTMQRWEAGSQVFTMKKAEFGSWVSHSAAFRCITALEASNAKLKDLVGRQQVELERVKGEKKTKWPFQFIPYARHANGIWERLEPPDGEKERKAFFDRQRATGRLIVLLPSTIDIAKFILEMEASMEKAEGGGE